MTDAERLQDHLNLMRTGQPLVRLTRAQQLWQAKRLRDLGMNYAAIALVMGSYHGEWITGGGWSYRLRRAGLHRPQPRRANQFRDEKNKFARRVEA